MIPTTNHLGEIAPPIVNHSAVDAFTLAHFGAGALGALLGLGWRSSIAIASGWELLERPLKRHFPRLFPNPSQDSDANMISDVVAWMAGWGVMQLRGRS